MGLDVYLKRCDNLADAQARQSEAEEFSEAQWNATGKEYSELTEDEKNAVRAVVKAKYEELGLDEYGGATNIETIELDSVTDPEHMFKIGYLRSSYNSGGINSVLERAGIPTLYDIFEPGDDYYATPDWEAALVKCEDAIQKFRDNFDDPMGRFDVMRITGPIAEGCKDENAALALFKEEYSKYQDRIAKAQSEYEKYSSFSNRDGEYFMEGVKAFAFIPNSGWGKGFHVVYEKERPQSVNEDWYFKALLITKETIAYVLSRPVDEQQEYFLGWSA